MDLFLVLMEGSADTLGVGVDIPISPFDVFVDDLSIFAERQSNIVVKFGKDELRTDVFFLFFILKLIKYWLIQPFFDTYAFGGVEVKHPDC